MGEVMTDLDLQSCPFCEYFTLLDVIHAANEEFEYQVYCQYCGLTGPFFDTEEEARRAWNGLPRRKDN